MSKGKIKLDNIIVRCEDVNVTPHTSQFEDWSSEDGIFQVQVAPSFKEVVFKTSVMIDRESLLSELDGKTVTASSDLFDTFQCVVKARKYGIPGGKTRAEYEVTLREDNPIA